jgi:ureidoglycolate lyase
MQMQQPPLAPETTVAAPETTRTVWVTARPLEDAAFAPFGSVLAPRGDRRPIDLYGGTIDVYRGGPIDADVPIEFLISRSSVREFRVNFLERHLHLAQSFFSLAGGGFIAVVARPEAKLGEHGIPEVDEIHAFLVPTGCGITLHRGTWHEPPFPLGDNLIRLTTSHADLSAGLESVLNERNEISTLDVDKRNITERSGIMVRIALP